MVAIMKIYTEDIIDIQRHKKATHNTQRIKNKNYIYIYIHVSNYVQHGWCFFVKGKMF